MRNMAQTSVAVITTSERTSIFRFERREGRKDDGNKKIERDGVGCKK